MDASRRNFQHVMASEQPHHPGAGRRFRFAIRGRDFVRVPKFSCAGAMPAPGKALDRASSDCMLSGRFTRDLRGRFDKGE
jgi:hypothetical protein